MSLVDKLLYGNSSAKAALEIGFFDAVGNSTKKTMSELMGGQRRNRAPVLWMLATGTLPEDNEEAKVKMDEGFSAFKIKVGGSNIDNDIDRARKN